MAYPLLLHGKHHRNPPTYQPLGQWLVPWNFQSMEAEYQSLRTGAGLIDYSTQALIEVRGSDRVRFLDNLLTNDIQQLLPGSGCQAALLTPTGKLISDLIVFADEDVLWLLCEATRSPLITQTLDHYVFSEQVSLANHERAYAVLAIQGPRTMEVLTQCLGEVMPFPHSIDHTLFPWQGNALRFIRHSLIGGVGVLCLCPADRVWELWEWWRTTGMAFGLGLVGWNALNTARIEAGIPWFGLDMDESNLLPETDLTSLLSSDSKGCYPGQEIVARLLTYGSVSKKLVGLLIETNQVPETGDVITHAGKDVGRVTSACFSFTLNQPVALGYVKRGTYERGIRVQIMHQDCPLPAMVVPRLLVRRT